MKFTRDLLGRKNQKGIALLLAIFTVVIITYLVTEILYETNVEYVVNSGSINRIKAYYAAKSGLELSRLRIKIFQQTQIATQGNPGMQKMINMLWQVPFSWPPLIPEEASGVDKDLIQAKVKEATLDASYVTSISDEGSKIDVNDLSSVSPGLQTVARRLLLQIFEGRLKNDEEWARANSEIPYEEVINNIQDWVDEDQISLNGGDERALYQNQSGVALPPNRAFRTVEELRLVAGMTEEIFDSLKDRVTVYGMRAINPNNATSEVIKALDPSITEQVVAKVLARRNDPTKGPFQNEAEFWEFLNAEGANISPENQKIPLEFSNVTAFRIRSSGEFAGVSREIEAVVFDINAASAAITKEISKGAGLQSPASGKDKEQLPKGLPRIVYLIER